MFSTAVLMLYGVKVVQLFCMSRLFFLLRFSNQHFSRLFIYIIKLKGGELLALNRGVIGSNFSHKMLKLAETSAC